MPYDSQGNFYRVHNWEQDRINEIEIVSDRHDEEDDNFAEGLSNCLLKDGRTAMTGKLNMNNFKIQNVANATASKEAVNKSQLDAVSSAGVKLTGNQTIGGNKTFSGTTAFTGNPAIQNTAPALYLNSMDIIKGTAPSETQYAGITFRDSTGDIKGSLARILTGYQTNKESFISLYAFKSDATPATEAGLIGDSVTMHYPATGNPYATAPASDVANSIVTTINKSKAANGYFKLGNGLIIQWGKTANLNGNPSNPTYTTLPAPFTSSNYKVVLTVDDGPDYNNEYGIYVMNKTTTTFAAVIRSYEGGNPYRRAAFIAIGY